jgi:hypothetical protein
MLSSRSARNPSRWVLSFAVLALSLAGSRPAAAVGQVHFTGANGFGTTQQEALAAQSAGVTLTTISQVDFATGLTTLRNLDQGAINTGPPATATSFWNITNETGQDLIGDLYLVFAKPLSNQTQQGTSFSYDPADVGLDLLNNPGWVIFEVDLQPNPVYYPAVLLGSLGNGQTTASPFAVKYILDGPQIFFESDGFIELGIPQWQLFSFFVPIPEPSTALLVGGGLALIAGARRGRSSTGPRPRS